MSLSPFQMHDPDRFGGFTALVRDSCGPRNPRQFQADTKQSGIVMIMHNCWKLPTFWLVAVWRKRNAEEFPDCFASSVWTVPPYKLWYGNSKGESRNHGNEGLRLGFTRYKNLKVTLWYRHVARYPAFIVHMCMCNCACIRWMKHGLVQR